MDSYNEQRWAGQELLNLAQANINDNLLICIQQQEEQIKKLTKLVQKLVAKDE